MKLYTSYFGFLKNIPREIIPVSIARFPPAWFDGCEMKMLAPEKKLLWKAKQGKISQEESARQSMARIREGINPKALYEELQKKFAGRDIVFLCFEKKGELC